MKNKFAVALGRKGGNANTERQQAARQRNCQIARASRWQGHTKAGAKSQPKTKLPDYSTLP